MTRMSSPKSLLSFGLVAALAACTNAPPPMQKLPDMNFAQGAPIQFDVARIEVVNEYKAPAQLPHIEYDMPVSPEAALRNWVRDRLKASGRSGTLRVVIKRAEATETPLATDQGFTGMFKKEQGARLDVAVDVTLQMLDDRQFVVADVSGSASASRTEPEDQKLNQRDRLLYDQVYALVQDFNGKVTPRIPDGLNKWILR
jgi:hypothetical protein